MLIGDGRFRAVNLLGFDQTLYHLSYIALNWFGNSDSNRDHMVGGHICYRYTITE